LEAEINHLDQIKADKEALERVKAELVTINQTIDAHAQTVTVQFDKVNSAAAQRNTEVDETLSIKLEDQALDELRADIRRLGFTKADKEALKKLEAEINHLDQIKADKEALERVKAELVTINQTIDAHAQTVTVQFDKVNSAAAQRNTEVDEALSTKAEEDFVKSGLRRLEEVKADKTYVENTAAKLDQTFAAHAQTVLLQFEKMNSAAAERNTEVDEVASIKLEEESLTGIRAELAILGEECASFVDAELAKRDAHAFKRELEVSDRASEMEQEMKRQRGERAASKEVRQQEARDRAETHLAELKNATHAASARHALMDAEMTSVNLEAVELSARYGTPQLAAFVDTDLSKKSGSDFLAAQVAHLSWAAKTTLKALESALTGEIGFTPSSHVLTNPGLKIVKKVADVLQAHPTMTIRVEGHTGCKCIAGAGQPKTGQQTCKAVALSQSRAESVITALKNLGCQNKFLSTGHGCTYRVGLTTKVFPAAGQ